MDIDDALRHRDKKHKHKHKRPACSRHASAAQTPRHPSAARRSMASSMRVTRRLSSPRRSTRSTSRATRRRSLSRTSGTSAAASLHCTCSRTRSAPSVTTRSSTVHRPTAASCPSACIAPSRAAASFSAPLRAAPRLQCKARHGHAADRRLLAQADRRRAARLPANSFQKFQSANESSVLRYITECKPEGYCTSINFIRRGKMLARTGSQVARRYS